MVGGEGVCCGAEYRVAGHDGSIGEVEGKWLDTYSDSMVGLSWLHGLRRVMGLFSQGGGVDDPDGALALCGLGLLLGCGAWTVGEGRSSDWPLERPMARGGGRWCRVLFLCLIRRCVRSCLSMACRSRSCVVAVPFSVFARC